MRFTDRKIPAVGMRIMKSAIGIWLCYVVQRLRGNTGIVFYSQLAVLWCIQPYVKDSLKNGIQRGVGTAIGAFYGLIVVLLKVYVFHRLPVHEDFYGFLVGLFIIAVIYTTVVIHKKNASYFSSVVFLSIVVNHIADVNPFIFVWNRIVDTLIGIVLGVGINMFHIPYRKQKDILFVSGIDDTLINEHEQISAYSLIELNRMLGDGAKFTVSTMRTPASVMDSLRGIHWTLPLIVMDGAALYDMREHTYLKIVPLEKNLVSELKELFREQEQNCFLNILIGDTLLISHGELITETEKSIYRELRQSPYRNFVKKDLSEEGEVLYFMSVGEKEKMDSLYHALTQKAYFDKLKILYYSSTTYEGQMYLKIYNCNATKENMIEYLKKFTNVRKTTTFGSIEGKYDITIHRNEHDEVVRILKKMYEPYFFVLESSLGIR